MRLLLQQGVKRREEEENPEDTAADKDILKQTTKQKKERTVKVAVSSALEDSRDPKINTLNVHLDTEGSGAIGNFGEFMDSVSELIADPEVSNDLKENTFDPEDPEKMKAIVQKLLKGKFKDTISGDDPFMGVGAFATSSELEKLKSGLIQYSEFTGETLPPEVIRKIDQRLERNLKLRTRRDSGGFGFPQ